MSFENPPPPGKSYSPLTMTAMLFFCIGFATAYAVFAIWETDFSQQAADDGGTATPPETSPATATPPQKEPVAEAPPTPAPVEEPPSPGDLDGHWPGRYLVVGISGTKLDDATRAMLAEYRPGGILLRPENIVDPAQTRNLTLAIRTAVGLGTDIEALPLIYLAQEGGSLNPLGVDEAPSLAELGAADDPARVQRVARKYGLTARARGISALLAPTMDVYVAGTSEDWLKDRTFGSEPQAASQNAISFAQGLADAGVIAVGKHFPGLGPARISPARVYEIPAQDVPAMAFHLLPFAEAAKMGIPALLAGHAATPNLDKQNPTRPASLSPLMIQTVLREKLGFEDLVIADDISTHPATNARPPGDVVVEAILAGCDAVVISGATPELVREVSETILLKIEEEVLSPARLLQSRARLDARQAQVSEWVPPTEGEFVDAPPSAAPVEVAVPDAPVPVPEIVPPAAAPQQAEAPPAPAPEKPAMTPEPTSEDTPAEPKEVVLPKQKEEAAPADDTAAAAEDFIVHTVKPGEMLRRLAESYGSTEAAVVKLNGLSSPDVIQVGQKLKIPAPKKANE